MVNSSRKSVKSYVNMVSSFLSRVNICIKTVREWFFLVNNDFIDDFIDDFIELRND